MMTRQTVKPIVTESLEHRLIIFYGSSPGSGKSSLSSWLSKQLEFMGFKCLWIYEDDIAALAEFEAFIRAIETADTDMIDTLLSAVEAFTAKVKPDEILVTDSIFPCFNWLLATGLYNPNELTRFSERLLAVLRPLRPVVFFLNVSPELALERAVKQRGDNWLEQLVLTVDGYGCNADKAITSRDDVVAFFKTLANKSLRLLEGWNALVLNAETHSVDDLKQQVLERLHLQEVAVAEIALANPAALTGVYRSGGLELAVYQLDGHLRVNTYWANGCELVPATKTRFFLKDTSYHLDFLDVENELPQTLLYYSPTETRRYQRVK